MLVGTRYSTAQNTTSKDKIEAIKIGFLTEKLDLSSAQAVVFWPLYNEYSSKKKELKAKASGILAENRLNQMTEEQVLNELKVLNQMRTEELELDKEYMAKFSKVISNKQVAKWYLAEKEFVRILLRKLEEK